MYELSLLVVKNFPILLLDSGARLELMKVQPGQGCSEPLCVV